MYMTSFWGKIASFLDSAFLQDGVWFAPVSDVFVFSFVLGITLVADAIVTLYICRALFSLIKALIRRFIYPGRKSSGKEPDKSQEEKDGSHG